MPILTALRRAERAVLVALFLAMVALFSLGVVAREIGGTFASQFAWIEEAVRLMNVFLVFLGLGLALERGRHVCIDTLRDRFGPRIRSTLQRSIDATGFVFSLYLAWLGAGLVQFVLNSGQRSPTLDVPMGYIYLAPVIGFGLLALRYALSFFGLFDRFAKPVTGAAK
jgi:TRAP-type C4-dicarboxylate transport system permease small subunit